MKIQHALICAVLAVSCPAHGAAYADGQAEARTVSYFQSIRSQPPLLRAFLKQMPKGGDLHNHLSGAVYAESMISWAAEDGVCIDDKTHALSPPPCDAARGQNTMKNARRDPLLYRQLVDSWSMRNLTASGHSGHDHFFDSFDKFDLATRNREGDMLAEVTSRAAAGGVNYLELMLTPALTHIAGVASAAGWHDDFDKMRTAMLELGMTEAVETASVTLAGNELKRQQILRCDSVQADPGCAVTVRYLYQVLRGLPAELVFAQMLAGFELASTNTKAVGLNLVMPEDAPVPMQDFALHMRMLDYLHQIYPKVHITLHAGELTPGLVPPEGLRFHIRDSIAIGHAERIGHGVDVMQEDDALPLLRKMARDKILVEICLTSNDGILGVRGTQHPLSAYLKMGVPVALATDDEGVSRSEMTQEYVKAVQEQHLDYRQLKAMARNSLQYSFAEGAPLWLDFEHLRPVVACSGHAKPDCHAYLMQNTKARLQQELEAAFTTFERKN